VQRLAIARALLHDPLVLLLDEPDTGLDPQAAEMLHNTLAKLGDSQKLSATTRASSARAGDESTALVETYGRTIVTITHSLERGLAIADRLVIMAAGRIVYEAPARGLASSEFRPLYDKYVGGGR
jgi:heme exporter protein A